MDPKMLMWVLMAFQVPERFVEEEFKLLDDDENEDEDASENDEFDLLTDQEIPLVAEPSL